MLCRLGASLGIRRRSLAPLRAGNGGLVRVLRLLRVGSAGLAAVLALAGADGLAAGGTVSGLVVTPLPDVQGPLPVTATSYPWNAAAHGLTPIDLSAHRYVEQEYLINGSANVYSEGSNGGLTTNASGPYQTRILIRRPASPGQFSGNVILELNNPTSNYDVDIMWAADHDYFMSHGTSTSGSRSSR
jgi:hypothetical protein